MTGTTPEISTGRELPLEPGGEVELLLTSTSVLLRGVERDVVTVRSLSGGDVEDDFTIERLPGKVRIRVRDNVPGFRIGPLRVGGGGPPDLEIEVPRTAAVALRTVSGDVEATGLAGTSSWATTSGDVRLRVDGGPVTAESMSGDVDVVAGGPIELKARSVSGNLTLHGPRFDALAASTTSGDVRIDAALGDTADHVISSVSGDVELATPSEVRVDTQSITGDVRAGGTVRSEGKRGRRVLVVGTGTVGVSIRTTSGDIRLRGGPAINTPVPAAPELPAAPPVPEPPVVPAAPVAPVAPAPPIVIVAEAEAAPNLVRAASDRPALTGPAPANDVETDPVAPGAAGTVAGGGGALDRREAARLEILRALERGDLDIEAASHRLEILDAAGPRFFRGVVLMAADPLDAVLRLVAEGRLTAEEAGPILAALDERLPGDDPADPGDPSTGPRSDPPGGFGANPPPSAAPPGSSAGGRGDGPRTIRIEVTDAGRPVVNVRLPIAVGKLALDRIPGLPAEHVSRVRELLQSGYRGSVVEVDDDGDGVRIVLE